MSLEIIKPLYKRVAGDVSLEEFHRWVNVVFHDEEAQHYDSLHNDMVDSLQQQFDLLIDDLLKSMWRADRKLNVLDIGCGTGLSSECLLNTELASQIDSMMLLDTSSEMILKAKEKAKTWNVPCDFHHGELETVDRCFDAILVCSVFHHIPDLEKFLKKIDSILNSNGLLIHLQDPNKDFIGKEEYLERSKELQLELNSGRSNHSSKSRYVKNIKKILNRLLGRFCYIDIINNKLLQKGIIRKRMTADEIWSITDIHINSKLNDSPDGISFQYIKSKLPNFSLKSRRSYGFFGPLKSKLPESFKVKEEKLIEKGELNGRNIACVWVKN